VAHEIGRALSARRVDLLLEPSRRGADELLHALGLRVEAVGRGEGHLGLSPGAVPFDLLTLGRIGRLAGTADAGEVGGAETGLTQCPPMTSARVPTLPRAVS
jgi:hypothetical protein